jgi:hypothetical protein
MLSRDLQLPGVARLRYEGEQNVADRNPDIDPVVLYVSRGDWSWQEDEIKIAIALHGRRNAQLRRLRLEEMRDRRMAESDGPLNRAAH